MPYTIRMAFANDMYKFINRRTTSKHGRVYVDCVYVCICDKTPIQIQTNIRQHPLIHREDEGKQFYNRVARINVSCCKQFSLAQKDKKIFFSFYWLFFFYLTKTI